MKMQVRSTKVHPVRFSALAEDGRQGAFAPGASGTGHLFGVLSMHILTGESATPGSGLLTQNCNPPETGRDIKQFSSY
jgi:hypothetical protein